MDEQREIGRTQHTPVPYDLIPAAWARLLYGAVFIVVLGLLVVDVGGISDWEVDNSAIALIAILALLPMVGRVKSAKVGTEGVSVEMFERFEQELKEVEDLTKRNAVGVARAAELELMLVGSDEDVTARASPLDEEDSRQSAPTPIQRVVWVDDRPENNAPYREELERRWEVVTATSTREGIALISADPAPTLVITDAVREEGGQTKYEAGLELIAWLRDEHPDVPVLVFAGEATVREHGDVFRAARASAVTADFGELLEAIGAIDRRRLMGAVAAKLRQPGLTLVAPPPGVDLLARQPDGRSIAIEVKTWQRTPPLQSVKAAIDQLAAAQRTAGAEKALLVVRTGLPHATAVGTLPSDLRIVPFDELERVLAE
jgi:CheY-like chemotaxis protein